MKLSSQEYFKISRNLEIFGPIFYKFWEIGEPLFTNTIKTAAICFDKNGCNINYLINPDFWAGLNEEQKIFTVCHECLHVILNHGIRSNAKIDELKNIAMDIIVNELLVNKFKMNRKEIDPENQYCWADKIPIKNIEKYTFEQIYEMLLNKNITNDNLKMVDEHNDKMGEVSKEIIDKLDNSLSNNDKENIKKIIEKNFQAGDEDGELWHFANTEVVIKKKKWETIIKQWSKKYLKNDFDSFEHWVRSNKRMLEIPDEIILPTEMELQEKEDNGKIDVFFFLDTSGSCYGYADRFFKAAKSLPEKRFNLHLFCFDTKVYDVDIKQGKLYGFGGTKFSIIEKKILEYGKYPSAIFVITDGYGDTIKISKPKNWYWFLIENGSKLYIPKECKIFNLSDFE